MNIIFTSFTYWPDKNGVQNVVQYQAEGLVRLGHTVTVITSDEHKLINEEYYNGVRIIRIPAYKNGLWVKGNKYLSQKTILEVVNQADVLLCACVFSFLDQWILPLFSQINCKKIGLMHGIHQWNYTNEDKKSIKAFSKKLLQNIRWKYFFDKNWINIKKFGFVTHLHEKDDSVSYFQSHNYFNNRILYNAAEPELFKLDGVRKDNIIINVGTFHPRKNQKKCLEIFWKSELKEFELVLIGPEENDYYRELLVYKKKLEKMYGYRKVDILANISRSETILQIKKAKIYLMTSIWEAFPVSVIEAMATGAAFVSLDVGVLKYWPGGVVCQDDNDLILALNRMKYEWEKIGCEGVSYAKEHFQQDTQVKKLENIILDLP